LNGAGYPVTVALAPKTYAQQPGLLYEAHDYNLLGQAANYAFLMTYEWGYTYGPPMAVAPLPSVRRVLDYALTEIPAEKLLLGVPNYGYDWPLPFVQGESRATSISNEQAVALARQYGAEIIYDETAQSPYFHYRDEAGTAHEVWFEDARSIREKLLLAAGKNLHGVGYWNLDRPFAQNWLVLNALYHIQ
jgi:spore germination protein